MSNTYSQIHIPCVFAVKYRSSLIKDKWKEQLYKYISGIIQNKGHKVLAINGMADNVHIFFGMRPDQSLSDLMRYVKGESSEWVNLQKFTPSVFRWQEGYGAFSYSRSQISSVCNYIANQEQHHAKKTFIEEYREILKAFDVEYNDQYIFTEPV